MVVVNILHYFSKHFMRAIFIEDTNSLAQIFHWEDLNECLEFGSIDLNSKNIKQCLPCNLRIPIIDYFSSCSKE